MNKIVHLVLSDDTFGGFEHYVHITNSITSLNQLVETILEKLRKTLIFHKLENASILLQDKHFHIHGLTFDEIQNRSVNNTIYVCSH